VYDRLRISLNAISTPQRKTQPGWNIGGAAKVNIPVRHLRLSSTIVPRGMPSSGLWRRVSLVRTNVSEKRIASIIRVTRIGELGTMLVITSK
jgi:hypothetical protein